MKHILTFTALVFATACFGQEACPNVHDINSNGTIDIEDFLSILGLFADVDVDEDGVWDSQDECLDATACNYLASPTEPCSYLDALGECGGACEGDGDGDGICDDVDTCVGELDECGVCNGPGPTEVVIEDITILYDSVYLPQLEEWYVYEFGADTTFSYQCVPLFSCGDLVSYQGYDYETVQIGEQCWFAENLRSDSFANGEFIPTELSDSEWVSTTSAAMTIFGWGESGYDGGPPNVSQNLEVLGRLYNGYAAQDPRGLCPAGWQVPTDAQWGILEGFMGMSPEEVIGFGYRGSDEGLRLKSSNSPYFYWEGVDEVGFSAIGAGRKNGQDGFFHNPGSYGFWWTSTSQTEDLLFRRMLHAPTDKVNRESTDINEGFSIRCIQDSE
jgi:uncharacterized protein (TIGR02145 family)